MTALSLAEVRRLAVNEHRWMAESADRLRRHTRGVTLTDQKSSRPRVESQETPS